MKIAVIGKGNVGQALAPRFARAGHDVTYGVCEPGAAGVDGIAVASVAEAVREADAVLLAVHFGVVDDVLAAAGSLAGRIVIDCTNALDFANGLAWVIPADTSAAQIIAGKTEGRVVKAFNQVGAAAMAALDALPLPPVQFAASDDADAKAAVLGLMRDAGFDARDAGGLDAARDLESIARVWIAQAFAGMPGETAWMLAGPRG